MEPASPSDAPASRKRVIDSLLNHAALVLQRDELAKAQANSQALAEADRLKTALLAMVSHDFRSPITSIKASVGSLLQENQNMSPRGDSDFKLLKTVDSEADRLNRMVGNILDFSRLEAGAWKPRREQIPAEELVGAALDSFSAEQNNRIKIDLDPHVTDLWVDSVQMVQILTNLLENALKYAPNSDIELKLFSENERSVIEVLDRGAGLPSGDQQRIFEPFYRAREYAEGAIPGVGVGLALCYGLVEAHQGNLTARNREGGGAIFRIELPGADEGTAAQ
jgi:two-component system sensor histidine kinase KdpD